ncbi:hypothetical protein ACOME3_006103 [Neoechinorhynchus agilis]
MDSDDGLRADRPDLIKRSPDEDISKLRTELVRARGESRRLLTENRILRSLLRRNTIGPESIRNSQSTSSTPLANTTEDDFDSSESGCRAF